MLSDTAPPAADTGAIPILCVLGPTAAGKTGLAVELVQQYPLAIVSVDSALIYRNMNIGTAKPDAKTLAQAPHRLIDIIDPWQGYSVARFLLDVKQQIEAIWQEGKIPLLCGGTMLYFHALWNGLNKMPAADQAFRNRLQREVEASELGAALLHQRLQAVDPTAAAKIHPNDPQRLVRALEVYELTGVPVSQLHGHGEKSVIRAAQYFSLGLYPAQRAILHQRIEQRFDDMLAAGFEAEVANLKADARINLELASMRCVGYRQMWAYLAGEIDYSIMRDSGVAATRQLAKRQFTWMRRMQQLRVVDPLHSDFRAARCYQDMLVWLDSHCAAL